ncbi:LPS export ABC transporter periplasmic protein LptC [Xenococcus sp. PCC 7305]|uniref:LPS export ABC transporter periplasmic protein LptC n=1 Tax=Xenococcus sp. PCC 7305 TaxID=102125 RepID=UPI000311DB76|nr:LPS export ABC transporter periplasmic protein LptC [Xenococcus sp. PCC 7305]
MRVAKIIIAAWCLSANVACRGTDPQGNSSPQNTEIAGRSETQLLLNDAVLEQSSNQGNLSWKIKSETATYSADQKNAYLEKITANLIDNGKIILQVSAEQGEVRDNNNLILLQDKVVAVDPRSDIVLNSDRAEWRPQENILIITENLRVNNSNLEVTANQAKYFSDRENLELTGQVVVNAVDPYLIMSTERLLWKIPQKRLIGNLPWQVVRYQEDIVTDRLVADRGEVDLQQNILSLSQNIEIISLDPQLQIATNAAQWDYQNRLVTATEPIQVVDRQRQLDVTGNQGQVDLIAEVVTLQGGVKGIDNRELSTLHSQELTWDIPGQTVTATGNVVYNEP